MAYYMRHVGPTIQLLLDTTETRDELEACHYIMQLYGLLEDESLDDFSAALQLVTPLPLPVTQCASSSN